MRCSRRRCCRGEPLLVTDLRAQLAIHRWLLCLAKTRRCRCRTYSGTKLGSQRKPPSCVCGPSRWQDLPPTAIRVHDPVCRPRRPTPESVDWEAAHGSVWRPDGSWSSCRAGPQSSCRAGPQSTHRSLHPIRENWYQNRYQVRPLLPIAKTLPIQEVASLQALIERSGVGVEPTHRRATPVFRF